MARDLDEDPEQLAMVCPQLTTYVRAKEAFDSGDDAQEKAWKDSEVMLLVRKHTKEQMKRRAAERKKG